MAFFSSSGVLLCDRQEQTRLPGATRRTPGVAALPEKVRGLTGRDEVPVIGVY
jgi:hypothetical protein